MNKTLSINIAGYVFNIEEQAYEKLSRYLDSIKQNFRHEADCDEIMDDIEARIAELFQENLSDRKEVIVETDVEEIINIMGKPEDYVSEEVADNFNNSSEPDVDDFADAMADATSGGKTSESYRTNSKRLYRDEKNGHIGGVCQGLGRFFGIDPTLVRLGFLLLTILGGSGVLIYIILWIVVPQAKTTAEVLEMQGEPVNLGSIKDHVKNMKEDVKTSAKQAEKNVKRAVNRASDSSSQLVEVLTKIIGGIFVVGGVFALFILAIVFFGGSGIFPFFADGFVEDLPTFLSLVYPSGRSALVFTSIILVTAIPVISGIVLGMKMLLNIKYRLKTYSIVASIVWLLACGTLVLTGIELGMNFRNHAEVDYEVPVQVDSNNVLIIDVEKDDKFSDYIEYQDVWNYAELIKVDEEEIHLGYPELKIIEQVDSGDFSVTLYKKSNAKYYKEAIAKSENIDYGIEHSQNHLTLSPYFSIDRDEKMRNQKVTVVVKVPRGKTIKFGPNIDRILVGIEDDYHRYNASFANTTWTSGVDGFMCLECEERRMYDDDDFDININVDD